MKKTNYWYPVQVWLMTVVILGPVLLLLSFWKDMHAFPNYIPELVLMLLTIIYGLIFSLPVLLIDFLIFKFLVQRNYSKLLIKQIIAIVSVIGIILTLHIVTPYAMFAAYLCYSLAFIISCIIMKPYKKTQKALNQITVPEDGTSEM
jgi:hypothetical protein